MKSLRGVLCEVCRRNGHCCQAQIWIGRKPLCMRCSNGEPCCFETAKNIELPDWRRDSIDIYTMEVRQIAYTPPPATRTVRVQTPKFEAREMRQMRAELETTAPEKVALRHGLDVAMVEEFQAKDEARQEQCESKEREAEQAPSVRSITEIQELVAAHFGMTRAELKSSTRERKILRPRQIAIYLASSSTPSTLGTLGKAFGGMHHTTIYHSIQVIGRRIKTDTGLENTVRALEEKIGAAVL
jgi:hypothetical protein